MIFVQMINKFLFLCAFENATWAIEILKFIQRFDIPQIIIDHLNINSFWYWIIVRILIAENAIKRAQFMCTYTNKTRK